MSGSTHWRHIILAAIVCALSVPDVCSAAFPEKPVHAIVGYAPGGTGDFLTRLIGGKLAEKWGQPLVIENKPGAGTTLATDLVAHAPADGYTLLFTSSTLTIPAESPLNYDPVKSLAPIIVIGKFPEVLVVNPTLGVNSLKEFLALARAKPGQLNYGSTGVGTWGWLEMELVMKLTDIKMTHVGYKGGGQTLVGILGNEIQAGFVSVTAALEQVRAGKLKALAVSSNTRSHVLPDVPTVAEAADLSGYDAGVWNGFLAPAGTPRDVLDKIHNDMAEATKLPDVQKSILDQGIDPVAGPRAEFTEMVASDVAKWAGLLKNVGAK